ncbi:hypothetical protein ACJMK2_035481 [Sinanodonta woodiana]|uniref:Uncharacterized protein n=1 Tax=Sinanodonta woodiana TaxID=1069815 RepID=A0ABD3WYK9_SINWO
MIEALGRLLLMSAILMLFSVPTVSAAALSNQTEDQGLFYKTLETLRKTLNFFKREYRNVNLDTIIGTRIVEDIGALLAAGFWELKYPSRDFTGLETYWPYQPGETLREEDSDNCLAEFFGTGSFSEDKCRISSKCWKAMTQPGYNGYSLSHQVFYLQIGEQFGCREGMEWHRLLNRQPTLDKLSATFCFNMLREASLIYMNGFPEGRQDLFMEQAALCGMMGYREFFESNWLQAILSWYDENKACYTGHAIFETEVEILPVASRGSVVLSRGCPGSSSTINTGRHV